MSAPVPVADLVFDPRLYPRQDVSAQRVTVLRRAMDAGEKIPAIIADEASLRIVDGVHRWHAARARGDEKILADLRDYESEALLFQDAVLLNSAHGLPLTTHDHLKVIETGESLGLRELDLAKILRTSVEHLRAIKPRYATVQDAIDDTPALRKVALKASTRHLSGKTVTTEQAAEITGRAPGQSYLLTVRQLAGAIQHGLLPVREEHPVLWAELESLQALLAGILG